MNKVKPLQFAKGVTMTDLNQFNHALKNDFINSLICTAFKVFPFINTKVSGIRVVNGFVSEAHAKAIGLIKTDADKAFTNGTAIEFTWTDYDPGQAVVMFRALLSEMPDCFELLIKPESVVIFSERNNKILSQQIKHDDIFETRIISKQ